MLGIQPPISLRHRRSAAAGKPISQPLRQTEHRVVRQPALRARAVHRGKTPQDRRIVGGAHGTPAEGDFHSIPLFIAVRQRGKLHGRQILRKMDPDGDVGAFVQLGQIGFVIRDSADALLHRPGLRQRIQADGLLAPQISVFPVLAGFQRTADRSALPGKPVLLGIRQIVPAESPVSGLDVPDRPAGHDQLVERAQVIPDIFPLVSSLPYASGVGLVAEGRRQGGDYETHPQQDGQHNGRRQDRHPAQAAIYDAAHPPGRLCLLRSSVRPLSGQLGLQPLGQIIGNGRALLQLGLHQRPLRFRRGAGSIPFQQLTKTHNCPSSLVLSFCRARHSSVRAAPGESPMAAPTSRSGKPAQ